MNENEIGTIIIDTAFYLHKNLGPGLLESVYETVLARLLTKKGLSVQRQVSIPIEFEGEKFDEGFRADLFVEGKVIIELKSVEKITPVYKKQLLTYLKLTNTKLGYILNFGKVLMKEGIDRMLMVYKSDQCSAFSASLRDVKS
jgi:GxxExxY protein